MLSVFWDAAVELDPVARSAVEGVRFDSCRPVPLRDLFVDAGLSDVDVQDVVIEMPFVDIDDYWLPFLGGQGPAPSYVTSLSAERRGALRAAVRARLPVDGDGSIRLAARAWAVRGVNE
jgi:hypothetical protein